VYSQFNHRKYGHGKYDAAYCGAQDADKPFADYLGHNIACVAVDENGRVLDFQFNHNCCFASTVEHAESRLLRRLFSVKDVAAHHRPTAAEAAAEGKQSPQAGAADDDAAAKALDRYRKVKYSKMLKQVTMYTSLESCAQCSGIMALARLKDVVFLQPDRGMYAIGNIMRNASPPWLRAPLPVPLSAIGLGALADEIDGAFEAFEQTMMEGEKHEDATAEEQAAAGAPPPFWTSPNGGKKKWSASVTTFLCSDAARAVFGKHDRALREMELAAPAFRPHDGPGPDVLTNALALAEARDFLQYVQTQGGRGTHNIC